MQSPRVHFQHYKNNKSLGMMVPTYSPSTQAAKEGGSPQIRDQAGLQNDTLPHKVLAPGLGSCGCHTPCLWASVSLYVRENHSSCLSACVEWLTGPEGYVHNGPGGGVGDRKTGSVAASSPAWNPFLSLPASWLFPGTAEVTVLPWPVCLA